MNTTDKNSKQWFFEVPWGKLALVSWGNPASEPVLCVHGYMDSAATFIPLMKMLPNSYYYVAVEFPGHGLSDPYPVGLLPSQAHLVEVIRATIEHLKWSRFIYLGHSMAFIIGTFYNAAYPQQITKMINIDPGPALSTYWPYSPGTWFRYLYEHYYSIYDRYNTNKPRLYTHEEAVRAVIRSRGLSEEQADLVLSRSLIPVGGGLFRLSWDAKMKKLTNILMSTETLITLMVTNIAPTLNILASEDISIETGKEWSQKTLRDMGNTMPNLFTVNIEGGHDLHITHPEQVALHVNAFLKRDFSIPLCKI